jgi:hypothetical protein
VWVNCSQPCFCQAPWGGTKRSGFGRELGPWGLDNYISIKQVRCCAVPGAAAACAARYCRLSLDTPIGVRTAPHHPTGHHVREPRHVELVQPAKQQAVNCAGRARASQ